MEIMLYKTTSDVNVVNKSLTNETHLVGDAVPNCDLLNPSFTVMYFANIVNYNYLYAFNRYYYIDGINMISGTHCVISCSVDVLMTYASAIKNCDATIVRSESIGKPTYIEDTQLPINPNEKLIREVRSNVPFTYGENQNIYVLTTLKGGTTNGS